MGPQVVHSFAYAAVGTIHAAAIGTDLPRLVRPYVASCTDDRWERPGERYDSTVGRAP